MSLGPAVRKTARPSDRLFRLVFGSHDGGAGVPIEEKQSLSDIDTEAVDSLKVLDPNRPIREAAKDPERLGIDGVICGSRTNECPGWAPSLRAPFDVDRGERPRTLSQISAPVATGRSDLGTRTILDALPRRAGPSSPSIVRRRSRRSLPRLPLVYLAGGGAIC